MEARGAGHGTPHPADHRPSGQLLRGKENCTTASIDPVIEIDEDVPLEAAALVGRGVPTGFAGTDIRGVVVVD